MLFEDTYKTISTQAEGIYKEKGSKFIAFAVPADTEEKVKEHISDFRKRFHDARHQSYAYRLGFDKSAFRINDDGEPSGTAGRPIYSQIITRDLTNVLVIVIRYFGGIKLGVSGLIRAYKTAADAALENSEIITKTVHDLFEIEFEYGNMEDVMKIVKENTLNQISHNYNLHCSLTLSVRKGQAEQVYEKFNQIKQLRIKYLHSV